MEKPVLVKVMTISSKLVKQMRKVCGLTSMEAKTVEVLGWSSLHDQDHRDEFVILHMHGDYFIAQASLTSLFKWNSGVLIAVYDLGLTKKGDTIPHIYLA